VTVVRLKGVQNALGRIEEFDYCGEVGVVVEGERICACGGIVAKDRCCGECVCATLSGSEYNKDDKISRSSDGLGSSNVHCHAKLRRREQ
jgi:hypothetical protein